MGVGHTLESNIIYKLLYMVNYPNSSRNNMCMGVRHSFVSNIICELLLVDYPNSTDNIFGQLKLIKMNEILMELSLNLTIKEK